MQIKPRQNLLSIWQSVARHCYPDGAWDWGESGGVSSVADAERLLCLLYPATEFPAFRLDAPDTTQPDVEKSLKAVGDATEIPESLVRALTEFMEKHRAGDTPTFSGGHYFTTRDPDQELSKEQRALGVVDSFSLSVTLCLATLGFLKVYQTKTERSGTLQLIERLRQATSDRLTAAMVSLLRSFTVDVYEVESPQGQALCRLIGQGRTPDRMVLQQFQERFRALRAVIRESVVLGVDVEEQLGNENRLFECGWAWSLVKGAPQVDTGEPIGDQADGVARGVPYLYFTVVALDGIQDLFSDRTLVLGLLNPEQQKLADALRLRWTITQQYWSGIARFDDDRWPLEDIPWRTTGQQLESEYFSLSVASILVHDLVRRRATDDDLTRTVGVMERLAERSRITSSTTREDPAVLLHNPGVALPLQSDDPLGPPMRWTMTDFSAQLLKRVIQLCALSRNVAAHDRLLRLAEQTLDHLWARRISDGEGVGLWDNVHATYPDSADRQGRLSWNITERVTECMVAAQQLYTQAPIRSPEPTALARSLLSEATHLLGTEQMEQPAPIAKSQEGTELKGIEADLRRARILLDSQPGTSCALTLNVLGRLDALARARAAGRQGV
ncbi:SCO2524 family protein [Streptomyces sp. NBC_00820]|uniref:SCO2524 family protein n=1 Tax=Streptomyces sp. NBC_00820 TaxID=2975842 RepID=UPI002ED0E1BD|nr:SCO2524 family protein [Streptomyces sp. NBC_00820]